MGPRRQTQLAAQRRGPVFKSPAAMDAYTASGAASVPVATLAVVSGCCALTAYRLLVGGSFEICAGLVLYKLEVWRIFTSVLAHGSLLHLVMNMMSLAGLGAQLEPVAGTVRFAGIMLVLTVVSNVMYL